MIAPTQRRLALRDTSGSGGVARYASSQVPENHDVL